MPLGTDLFDATPGSGATLGGGAGAGAVGKLGARMPLRPPPGYQPGYWSVDDYQRSASDGRFPTPRPTNPGPMTPIDPREAGPFGPPRPPGPGPNPRPGPVPTNPGPVTPTQPPREAGPFGPPSPGPGPAPGPNPAPGPTPGPIPRPPPEAGPFPPQPRPIPPMPTTSPGPGPNPPPEAGPFPPQPPPPPGPRNPQPPVPSSGGPIEPTGEPDAGGEDKGGKGPGTSVPGGGGPTTFNAASLTPRGAASMDEKRRKYPGNAAVGLLPAQANRGRAPTALGTGNRFGPGPSVRPVTPPRPALGPPPGYTARQGLQNRANAGMDAAYAANRTQRQQAAVAQQPPPPMTMPSRVSFGAGNAGQQAGSSPLELAAGRGQSLAAAQPTTGRLPVPQGPIARNLPPGDQQRQLQERARQRAALPPPPGYRGSGSTNGVGF